MIYLYQYSNRLQLRHWFPKFRRNLLLWLIVLGVVGSYLLNAYIANYRLGLPDVNRLRAFDPDLTTRIFSSDGQLIGTLFRENRTWVPLQKMSPWLIKAIIAVEDSRYYEHSGVDPIGVARAVIVDLKAGDRRQGASTITMQLARNLFLSPEISLERKFREALLAADIERRFSKNEILEFYLNQVYFGSGAYGAQAAASQYFRRSAARLTPAQAALLAGLPQAPSELSPFVNAAASKRRQVLVLNRMLKLGYLTWPQYRRAMAEAGAMRFKPAPSRRQLLKVPYFTSYVITQLSQRYSEEELYQGGLSIYTTVDLRLQRQAEKAINQLVSQDLIALNVHQAASVTLENSTGYIRAMVGGRGFQAKNQFNRAWQLRRPTGSAFKPVVYAAALESGLTPHTLVEDSPAKFVLASGETWEPRNSDGKSLGTIPLWLALERSRNVVSARLVSRIGPDKVAQFAQRFGLQELVPTLSLALGTAEASPLQMASLFSIFPNSGLRIQPTAILRVIGADKQILEDNRRAPRQAVLDSSVARTMVWMLRRAVDFGTGSQAKVAGQFTAGKTGTTDNYRDTWFVGFTPDYTTAVWAGNDDYSRMWGAFGGDLPARIFRRTMSAATAGKPARPLPALSPGPAVSVNICKNTHLRANPYCPKKYPVLFDGSLVSLDRCRLHVAKKVKPKVRPERPLSNAPWQLIEAPEALPGGNDE